MVSVVAQKSKNSKRSKEILAALKPISKEIQIAHACSLQPNGEKTVKFQEQLQKVQETDADPCDS